MPEPLAWTLVAFGSTLSVLLGAIGVRVALGRLSSLEITVSILVLGSAKVRVRF